MDDKLVEAAAAYVIEYCLQHECKHWVEHQKTPVYDAECELGLLDGEDEYSLIECPLIQRALEL